MKKEHFIIEAIKALVPKKTNWLLEENGNLIWGDNDPSFIPPTTEQINQKANELENEYNSKSYVRDRAKEYPSILDFADAWVKNDEDALEIYRQKCLAVKQKYPKPE